MKDPFTPLLLIWEPQNLSKGRVHLPWECYSSCGQWQMDWKLQNLLCMLYLPSPKIQLYYFFPTKTVVFWYSSSALSPFWVPQSTILVRIRTIPHPGWLLFIVPYTYPSPSRHLKHRTFCLCKYSQLPWLSTLSVLPDKMIQWTTFAFSELTQCTPLQLWKCWPSVLCSLRFWGWPFQWGPKVGRRGIRGGLIFHKIHICCHCTWELFCTWDWCRAEWLSFQKGT